MKPKKMNPEVFPNNTGIRKLYNDLKLEVEALREENKYLRNRTTKLLEKQNKLLEKVLNNCGVG